MTRLVRRLVVPVAVVAAVVVANVAAYRSGGQLDLSAARRFSLSAESRALARAVRAPLKITAFLANGGAAARDARFLLARYHELNPRISFRVIDPDQSPGEARRLGVSRYSTVVLAYRGRRVDAPDAEELELSTAILRILRGGTKTVCVLVGHGEGALDDTSPTGFSKVADLLRHGAYEPRPLDLAVGAAKVPPDCAAVLVIGPADPLLPQEIDALNAYAKTAGRLFVLATPASRADPNPLLAPWGIRFLGGLVVDPARHLRLDLSDVVVEDLPSASPVVDAVSRIEMPAAGGLITESRAREGLTVEALAGTSDRSWVESQPDVEVRLDRQDIPGPITVAAAADDSRVQPSGERRVPGTSGPRIERTRVVATGGSAWASNQFLDALGNRRLFVNALAWLAEEEQLVAATSRPNPSRPLPLTPERQTRVLAVTVGAVPGAIIVVGLVPAVVVRRRRRAA